MIKYILYLMIMLSFLTACSEAQQASENYGSQKAQQIKRMEHKVASDIERANRNTTQAIQDLEK